MKSLCIKTNNINILKYLLNELYNCNINDICFSYCKFKIYHNIIIHYSGNDTNYFLNKISDLLSILVIDEYEEKIFNNLLAQNYFYFDKNEKNKVTNIYYDTISNDFYNIFNNKQKLIKPSFYNYLKTSKSIVLDGFINFRLKDYKNYLDDLLHESVSYYIVQKEYLEFISLLKSYVYSQKSISKTIHLVYSSSESILLDENKEILLNLDTTLKSKFLSDISFSSNDYTLNSLLTLLPRNLYIHLIDDNIDEFITTLQLIFENKITICTNCNICSLYKQLEIKNLQSNT